ncbi:MAG TPA: PBP1A family penicillin-binding protein [Patescibacteria group bacterium]|nr:PBP1A family penicillin-binding protein [Patescibacteria group bacterium]
MKHFLFQVRSRLTRLKNDLKEKPMLDVFKEIIKELWYTGKRPLFYIAIAGVVLLILTPVVTYLYFVRDLSSKEKVLTRKNEGIVLLDRNDKPFFTFYEAKSNKTVPFSKITKDTQHAVIAIEDKDFYNHPGFSLEGIARALVVNLKREQFAQGGSTISQQLVKNSLLTQDKNLLRKYQEIVLAIELERRFTKEDILEMYLNTVYFGEGAFGIQDASNAYFGKEASKLSLAQSALLAGILPAPSAFSPLSGSREKAFKRQAIVLNYMEQQGYITKAQKENAVAEEIVFNPQVSDLNETAPHFALMVKDALIEKYGEQKVARSGYNVRTTIDLEDQEYAQDIVANQVTRLARNNVTNAAAIVIDPNTGEILALIGSHDWNDENNGKINMAVRPRQPGSSFKPIVYAKGFEERVITPATKLDDKPITFPDGYKPKNYDGKFRNEVSVRSALANSFNIPAIHVLDRVGIKDAIETAEDLGITTLNEPSRYGLSLVLGAAEVPLTEMTSAFAVFANEGVYTERIIILEVRDKRNNVIFKSQPKEKEVLGDDIAFLISSILSDNKARADTFGNALTISRTAAVKTGTTEDYRDALTIGYTPNLVVGVWVGNNDRAPMDSIAGSLGAAPIWRQLMERFLIGKPRLSFTPPASIRKIKLCLTDDLNNETASTSALDEYFLRGTGPKKECVTPTPTSTPEPTQTPKPEPTSAPEPTPTSEPQPTPTPDASTPTPVITITLP